MTQLALQYRESMAELIRSPNVSDFRRVADQVEARQNLLYILENLGAKDEAHLKEIKREAALMATLMAETHSSPGVYVRLRNAVRTATGSTKKWLERKVAELESVYLEVTPEHIKGLAEIMADYDLIHFKTISYDGERVELTPSLYKYVMANEPSSKERERIYRAFYASLTKNVPVFKKVVSARGDGFAKWQVSKHMFTDLEKNKRFLCEVLKKVNPILERLGTHTTPWDTLYNFAQEVFPHRGELKKWLPAKEVIPRVVKVVADICGVRIRRIDKPGWHRRVINFSVAGGVLRIDPYPRQLKYSHAACIPTVLDGKPTCVLMCNMSDMMDHAELVTLFHELGHAFHFLLCWKDGWPPMTADYAEIYSQWMENFAWDVKVLKEVADTDDPSFVSLAKEVSAGRQLELYRTFHEIALYGLFDLETHSSKKTPLKVYQEVVAKWGLQEIPSDSLFGFMGHLLSWNYSAGYYMYTVSLWISQQLWKLPKRKVISLMKTSPVDQLGVLEDVLGKITLKIDKGF